MALIRKIRKLLADFIAPKTTALVPVYVSNGTFSRLVEQDTGIVRGYHYRCDCGQEQTAFTPDASLVRGMCSCRKSFDLLQSLGSRSLSVLPTRALSVRAPQPAYQIIQVGEREIRDPWSGAPPSPGVEWR
jgi:hypothetical protein